LASASALSCDSMSVDGLVDNNSACSREVWGAHMLGVRDHLCGMGVQHAVEVFLTSKCCFDMPNSDADADWLALTLLDR
jgi:hypothetical protein